MKLIFSAVAAAIGLGAAAASAAATVPASAPVHHVLLISVDGLHGSDLVHYIDAHPDSTLAELSKEGIDYTNAHTVTPADSFPGLVALITGGTPDVTGVWYDDSYDRALAAPGSDCSRTGSRVLYDESVDGSATQDAHAIDPAKLPRDPRHGCAPVFPHAYLRVNTLFEAVRSAGGYTAWIDKHPTYELVEGPSGHGVDDLFLPEIGSNYEGAANVSATAITGSLARTEAYDDMKAHAIVNEIDGRTHDGRRPAQVPSVFGLNLQAINVAQKLYGYRDANGDLTSGVDGALGHVDRLLAGFVSELGRRGLVDDTLIVVTAKHGNGPIDPARLHKIDSRKLESTIDAAAPHALAQLTVDHGALIWLRDPSATQTVSAALTRHAAALGIADVLSGERLAMRDPAPAVDSRTPDIVVISRDGVIFTQPGDGKLAEHGGFHDDDTSVALLLSNPRLATPGRRVTWRVSTTQVAPTVLASLGLAPTLLQAVVREGTSVLPAAGWTQARSLAHTQTGTPSFDQ